MILGDREECTSKLKWHSNECSVSKIKTATLNIQASP